MYFISWWIIWTYFTRWSAMWTRASIIKTQNGMMLASSTLIQRMIEMMDFPCKWGEEQLYKWCTFLSLFSATFSVPYVNVSTIFIILFILLTGVNKSKLDSSMEFGKILSIETLSNVFNLLHIQLTNNEVISNISCQESLKMVAVKGFFCSLWSILQLWTIQLKKSVTAICLDCSYSNCFFGSLVWPFYLYEWHERC